MEWTGTVGLGGASKGLDWNDEAIDGSYRFLNRVWRILQTSKDKILNASTFNGTSSDLGGAVKELNRKIHFTIKKVTNDIENDFHFNTAISAVMELVNQIYTLDLKNEDKKRDEVLRFGFETIIILLSPFVPHITEELWSILGNKTSILLEKWPIHNEDALKVDELLIVVQINGKLRGKITVDANADDDAIKKSALNESNVKKHIEGKDIKKVIVVKKKLVNIVV